MEHKHSPFIYSHSIHHILSVIIVIRHHTKLPCVLGLVISTIILPPVGLEWDSVKPLKERLSFGALLMPTLGVAIRLLIFGTNNNNNSSSIMNCLPIIQSFNNHNNNNNIIHAVKSIHIHVLSQYFKNHDISNDLFVYKTCSWFHFEKIHSENTWSYLLSFLRTHVW